MGLLFFFSEGESSAKCSACLIKRRVRCVQENSSEPGPPKRGQQLAKRSNSWTAFITQNWSSVWPPTTCVRRPWWSWSSKFYCQLDERVEDSNTDEVSSLWSVSQVESCSNASWMRTLNTQSSPVPNTWGRSWRAYSTSTSRTSSTWTWNRRTLSAWTRLARRSRSSTLAWPVNWVRFLSIIPHPVLHFYVFLKFPVYITNKSDNLEKL